VLILNADAGHAQGRIKQHHEQMQYKERQINLEFAWLPALHLLDKMRD